MISYKGSYHEGCIREDGGRQHRLLITRAVWRVISGVCDSRLLSRESTYMKVLVLVQGNHKPLGQTEGLLREQHHGVA